MGLLLGVGLVPRVGFFSLWVLTTACQFHSLTFKQSLSPGAQKDICIKTFAK